jgi:hypothetical protein
LADYLINATPLPASRPNAETPCHQRKFVNYPALGEAPPSVRRFEDAPQLGDRATLALRPTALLWCDCHLFAAVRLVALLGYQVDVGARHRTGQPVRQDQALKIDAGTLCSPATSGMDRVHLAMILLGDHAPVSADLMVPDEGLALHLRHELRLLFEPCQDLAAPRTWLPQHSPAAAGGGG